MTTTKLSTIPSFLQVGTPQAPGMAGTVVYFPASGIALVGWGQLSTTTTTVFSTTTYPNLASRVPAAWIGGGNITVPIMNSPDTDLVPYIKLFDDAASIAISGAPFTGTGLVTTGAVNTSGAGTGDLQVAGGASIAKGMLVGSVPYNQSGSDNTLVVGSVATGARGAVEIVGNTANANGFIGFYNNTTLGALIQNRGDGATGRLGISQNGVDTMTIQNGKVGIGTTGPATALQINENGTSGTRRTALTINTAETANGTGTNIDFAQAGTVVGRISSVYESGGAIGLRLSTYSSGLVTDVVRFNSLGSLGILCGDPAAQLHINQASATEIPALGSVGGRLLVTNGNAYTNGGYGFLLGVNNVGNVWMQSQRVDATATAYNLLLNPSGGRVGIGTASPYATLTIKGGYKALNDGGNLGIDSSDALAADKGGGLSLGGVYTAGGSLAAFGGVAGYKTNATDGNYAGYLSLHTNTGTSVTEKMRITHDGNVGIGTTAPASPNGRDRVLDISAAGVGASSTPGLVLRSGSSYSPTTWEMFVNSTSGVTSGLNFASGTTTIMHLRSDTGRVGIGTTNPSTALHIYSGATPTQAICRLERTNGSASNSYAFTSYVTSSVHEWRVGLTGIDGDAYQIADGSNTAWLTIDTNGNLYVPRVYAASASGGIDCYVTSTGLLGIVTSSIRYKTNVQNMVSVDWLYDLRPVNFEYKKEVNGVYIEESDGEMRWGLIAEEVERVAPAFVFNKQLEDGSKQAEGVRYKELITPVIKALQELKAENDELKLRIAALEAKVP